MTTLNPQTTVAEFVRERPDRARIFESRKIDYCCGGKFSLAEACAKRGLDTQTLLDEIRRADDVANAAVAEPDPSAMSLTELADHIEQRHHAFLRSELPRLDRMTDRVHRVHGDRDPRLADVRRAFVKLQEEMLLHMLKEERILFPMIRAIESESSRAPLVPCRSLADPIRQMELEHQDASAALEIMRRSTDEFQPPEWACNTYRAMLDGLAGMEQDLHQHVHKENNVLFPRALAHQPR